VDVAKQTTRTSEARMHRNARLTLTGRRIMIERIAAGTPHP